MYKGNMYNYVENLRRWLKDNHNITVQFIRRQNDLYLGFSYAWTFVEHVVTDSENFEDQCLEAARKAIIDKNRNK